MAVYRYSQEVHDFVKQWSPKLRDDDLADACNKELGTHFTARTMKAFRGNHGYRNGKKRWTSEEYWKYQKRYPKGMYEFIKENSWGRSSKEMAEMANEKFGTDFTQTMMKQFRARHHIKSGLTGWYQKGHEPGTKGKTLEEICGNDPEKLARVRSTQFKKGHKPVNEKQVGDIVVVNGYKLRKKQMEGTQWERWEFMHRAVWEEHSGPIPDDMVVTFKDSDPLNCDISNLMLISRRENQQLTRMGLRFEDPDLTETAVNTVRLRNAISGRKKGLKNGGNSKDGGPGGPRTKKRPGAVDQRGSEPVLDQVEKQED